MEPTFLKRWGLLSSHGSHYRTTSNLNPFWGEDVRTVQMDELPRCDVCHVNDAVYDSKTVHGPHGYLCEDCFRLVGCPPTTRLEKRVKIDAGKTDEVPTVTVPLTLDSIADVRCPHCGEKRAVEPDANYEVTCESCGNSYRVESLI